MGLLLFNPWQSQTISEQQERNKQQGQNGAKVKMGFSSLPPDRVKLAVNSKKKQTAGSKWAKDQDGLLLFTSWKSQNVLLLFTPWQSQTNWTARKKQRVGSNWAKRSQIGPGPFWLGDNRVKLGQKESSWAKPILTLSQSRPRSQDGSEQLHNPLRSAYFLSRYRAQQWRYYTLAKNGGREQWQVV